MKLSARPRALVAASCIALAPPLVAAQEPSPTQRVEARAVFAAHQPTVAAALDDALDWLAREQAVDGAWRRGDEADVGVTGLALVAFLGAGESPARGEHAGTVARGLAWLRAQQDPDSGLIGAPARHDYLYGHAFATLALAESEALAPRDENRAALVRAVQLVERARNPYGAWRYDVPPIGDNDTSVTHWMIQALCAADRVGVDVSDAAYAGAVSWVEEVTDEATARVGYDARGTRSSRFADAGDYSREAGEAMTAAGLLIRMNAADVRGEALRVTSLEAAQVDLLLGTLPAWDPTGLNNDLYAWTLAAEATWQVGGTAWVRYRGALWPTLVESQRRFGELAGSWDPLDPWGSTGRVYATAFAALALEASIRHPRMFDDLAVDLARVRDPRGIASGASDLPAPPPAAGEATKPDPLERVAAGRGDEVARALGWLVAAQGADGAWAPTEIARRFDAGRGAPGEADAAVHTLGVTSLAALAFLNARPLEGEAAVAWSPEFEEPLARALGWIEAQQDAETGLLGARTSVTFLYEHALATLAVAEAQRAMPTDERRPVLQRAVNYALRARNPYAAWRYDVPPIGDNDTSVTSWMVLALDAAATAGAQVDRAAFEGAESWVREVTDPETGRIGYDSRGTLSARTPQNEHYPREAGEAMTAAGLLVLCSAAEARDEPFDPGSVAAQASLLRRRLPTSDPTGWHTDQYYWLLGTFAAREIGGGLWRDWATELAGVARSSQRLDAGYAGSWDPVGPWGYVGSRAYSTAALALALETCERGSSLSFGR